MGEAKRRVAYLGNNYGLPNVNAQVQIAWANINDAIREAKKKKPDYLIIQCCNLDKGFCMDAINTVRHQLASHTFSLDLPILIQMLPDGFTPSATKLFDGFITVWCNAPQNPMWQELFDNKIPDNVDMSVHISDF